VSASPAFEAARNRVTAALKETRSAITAMLGLVDPKGSGHDDVAELILSVTLLGEHYREIRPEADAMVLQWLLDNEDGIRRVRVGEWSWWGEKEKSVKLLDVGETGAALIRTSLGDLLMAALGGDVDRFEEVVAALRGFFRDFVSANGLKDGACRKALQDGAEHALRVAYAADPETIALGEGESPEAALERAVEAEREAIYLAHWCESWPDKLAGGEPKVKLGVANLRFVYRQGGGTKADFEEMERRRLAAGEV
jgi:hypothetical protein